MRLAGSPDGGPAGRLRFLAATAAAQLARVSSRAAGTGGGTTVPGVVARRVDPRVLGKLARGLPLGSVALTGTNGKTTATRMVARIFEAAGLRFVSNSTGANLVTGVTAALLADAGLSGRPTSEIGLFEVDEASVPKVAPEVPLRTLAVLNLFRDQLDRYGELAYTGEVIASAFSDLPADGTVLLNADDPLVASLGQRARSAVYFGVDEPSLDTGVLQHVADSKDCPLCGTPLDYGAVYFGHVGVYRCPSCSFVRPAPRYRATDVRLDGARGSSFRLETPEGAREVRIKLPGLYNVYNAVAAAAVAGLSGIGVDATVGALGEFGGAFGRMERVVADDREVFLLLIKNPVGFNEILRTFILPEGEAERVLIAINDNDADGRDVSWLWDVDFEMLSGHEAEFRTSGVRAGDMAVRLKYADIPVASVEPDARRALQAGLEATPPGGTLYVLPTYTAMLEIRRILSDLGHTHPFWEER
ncbi:UDP-N-acetylmuramyl tripeptide synthase [Rubrobacter radiotolerans]|uniref:Lipid II isoglutaminyl synthase (glutamine-hydrolyzing) subunit MurT n=1 Tax=Rubrobacter radiotolerans TaxID=42256 RepID=A0A023X3N9_RUBRA|nr:Mur ligase family protein [Rubrobacter radiotolerans]AHY46816.1 UDP-N-acetylmuramyl tripeptide synthase [Rubrobacter radiotolerans]MDX5894223.1 MurT ligase domain-containing protein [Rubrobacter radiotolerans]SMC05500.1 UDP-N-acetylmuramyl tripeptide synthase [Rubrobacter radiotolerans DSM 5868]